MNLLCFKGLEAQRKAGERPHDHHVPDVSKYIERAEQEAKRRNFDGAIALYAEILQIDPDSGEARSGLRRAALKKLDRRYPPRALLFLLNLPAWLLLGIARLFRAHGMVAGVCEYALRRDPRNPRLNLMLGNALLQQGHRNGAEAALAVVTEFDQTNLEALKTLGRLRYERKDLEGALDCFERALKVNPRDQDAARMRKNLAAEGAIQKGGYEEARSARDLAKSERQLKERERSQRIVRTSEDLESAIAELQEDLEKSPEDVKLLLRLASLQTQKRALDDAVDTLARARKLQPEDQEVAERLGDVRIRRLEERLALAERALEQGEEGAEDRVSRLKRELLDLQVEEFERRVELHPTDLGLRFRLGQYLLRDGRLDEAIEQFQSAVKDPRHRTAALHQLGRAFARKGLTDLAARQLEQAAESLGSMTSQRKEILYDLARVCERSGDPGRALTVYKEIYESDIGFKDVGDKIGTLSREVSGS